MTSTQNRPAILIDIGGVIVLERLGVGRRPPPLAQPWKSAVIGVIADRAS
ncbi:hypothetical protein [Kitasatospora aureofaciens]|nr:hypothetical protein [Kitasatospora aureofaciens]MBV6699879.1 hypothetical protein [Kitasatospora aureofaciens]